MVITGTLNSDHWCLKRFEGPAPRRDFRIGIATTNKSILFGVPVRSVVGLLSAHRLGNWEEALWRVDFAAYELAHMLLLTEVIERLRRTGWEISLRPHPHEHIVQWKGYLHGFGAGVELNRSLRIDEWLDTVPVVLSSFSTVSIDAIAHGIPSLSLHGLLPERFFDALPAMKKPFLAPYAWTPKSLEEFFDLIEKARTGSLAPSPEPELVQRFMAENFNFPRDFFACEEIAQTICRMIKNQKGVMRRRFTNDGTKTHKGGPLRLLCRIPGIRALLIMSSYVKAFLTSERRENLYFPFNIKQSKGSRGYVLLILRHLNKRACLRNE